LNSLGFTRGTGFPRAGRVPRWNLIPLNITTQTREPVERM
jgi:hypothetical protein